MRRLTILVLALLAAGAGVTVASVLGPGDPAPEPEFTAEAFEPQPDTVAVQRLEDDPAGGAAWGLRTYMSTTGLTCAEAGRVADGEFGRQDDAGFVSLPVAADGECADLRTSDIALAIRRYPATHEQAALGVVYGVVSTDIASVQYGTASDLRDLPTASNGGFLTLEPTSDFAGRTLVTTSDTGQRTEYPLDG
jgi:hypothetical protein